MPRGLVNMSEGGGGRSKQNAGFKKVMLYDDGESSKLRFLTDADEMYFDWFHKFVPAGGKWPTGRRICLRSAINAPCEDCDNDVPSVNEWMGWVYVYTQNLNKPGDGRVPVTVGRRTFYQEACNEVRLMRYASFHKASVKAQYERLGTLLDYEFDWLRQGAEKDNKVSYVLERGDKTPFPKELAALAADLPDLEDVAFGRATAPETATAEPTTQIANAYDASTDSAFAEAPGDETPSNEVDPFA